MEYIIPVHSILAKQYYSSTNFIYQLPLTLTNVREIMLVNGDIPYNTEKCLYYDIKESDNKKVHIMDKQLDGILRWDPPTVNQKIFLNQLDDRTTTSYVNIKNMSTISMQLYTYDGLPFNYVGPTKLDVVRMTSIPLNRTRIETSVNHGLLLNDRFMVRGVDNMSKENLNKNMNQLQTVVNVFSATEVDIAFDSTTEALNQTFTNYEQAYQFGRGARILISTGQEFAVQSLTAGVPSGTLITLYNNHGLTSNLDIKIYGMDNGLTVSDNNKINGQHTTVDIPGPNTIRIAPTLSGYPANNVKTDTPTPFLLGSHGSLFVEKYQTTFDLVVRTDGIKNELSDKLKYHAPDSLWKTKTYTDKWVKKFQK